MAVDPRGVAWLAERIGNKIGRFDPATLAFNEVERSPPGPAPADRDGWSAIRRSTPTASCGSTTGPNTRWLSYDTKTGKFIAFAWPKGHGGAGGNSMALHPNGTIWATAVGQGVRMLDPQTAEFKFFNSPSATTGKRPGAYGLAVAGDGSVWWAEPLTDQMARADPATGTIEEYKIPIEGKAYPRRMNNDTNGDLWVALWDAGKLMKIDYKTRQMTIYAPPTAEPQATTRSWSTKRTI